MSSSIFYRFKSQKDYSRISFDASQMGLTVFDIKRDIIQLERLGAGTDFDLMISNADSKQEYSDDAENIPRGTSIIVQRKPPSRGMGKGSAARYVTGNAIQVSSRQEFKKPQDSTTATTQNGSSKRALPPPPPVAGSSEEDAIRAMLAASGSQWQETQDQMALSKPVYRPGARGVPTGPVPDRPLPQGYICYRCGQKGHYIQACPTNGDDAFENRKRIKRTTGIPRSQLQKVETEAEDGEGNVMVNAEGESVMFVPDSASWETYQKNTQSMKQDELPTDSELACGICKKLMKVPVSVPCCKANFCEECIQGALLESDFICPTCGTKDVLLDQLTPNSDIQLKLDEYLESKKTEQSEAASRTEETTTMTTTADAGQAQADTTLQTAGDGKVAETMGMPDPSLAFPMPMPPLPGFMPPFDPMMMSIMGFPGGMVGGGPNPAGFPMMPPNFGFPPMPMMPFPPTQPLPGQEFRLPSQQQNQGRGHHHQQGSHQHANNRAHPYSRPK